MRNLGKKRKVEPIETENRKIVARDWKWGEMG